PCFAPERSASGNVRPPRLAGQGRRLTRRRSERLIEVADDVVDALDPDRKANHVRSGAGGDLLLFRQLAMGGRGRMQDEAACVADIGEVGEDLAGFDYLQS